MPKKGQTPRWRNCSLVAIEIRSLAPADERERFRSGNEDLDRFFYRFAGQNQFRHHVSGNGVTH